LIHIFPINDCGSIETPEISVRRPLLLSTLARAAREPIHNSKASQG
jgi:hypothetical protein